MTSTDLVPWEPSDWRDAFTPAPDPAADARQQAAIDAARGQSTVPGTLTPLDAYHSGWLTRLLEPGEVDASDPRDRDDDLQPGDDR